MNFGNVLDMLKEIKDKRGNQKLPLLIKYLDTYPLFQRVVQYTLDSRKTFKVKKVEWNESLDITVKTTIMDEIFNFLDYLDNKPGATKKDKEYLAALASWDGETFDTVSRILSRKLDCGIDVKTINKYRPGIVPYFPYMRCSTLDFLHKIKFPCYSQLKADGEYFDIFAGREPTFQTRNGKIAQFPHVPIDFLPEFKGKVMGEALVLAPDGKSFLPRKDGNALITNALYGKMPKSEQERVRFVLWDMVLDRHPNLPYKERFEMMEEWGIPTIETRIIHNIEDGWEHFDDVRNRDLEGTILKNFDGIYADGTSQDCIKLKGEKECELEVIDISPGTGKYEGMVGGLVCKSSCGKLLTTVGMGLNDEDRARNDWVGQIITTRFNDLSKSKVKDTYALTHARLIECRIDKDQADDLNYISKLKDIKRGR